MNLDVILWARDICPENGTGALPESSSKYAESVFCLTKNIVLDTTIMFLLYTIFPPEISHVRLVDSDSGR
jgi:hypothetical protein